MTLSRRGANCESERHGGIVGGGGTTLFCQGKHGKSPGRDRSYVLAHEGGRNETEKREGRVPQNKGVYHKD